MYTEDSVKPWKKYVFSKKKNKALKEYLAKTYKAVYDFIKGERRKMFVL